MKDNDLTGMLGPLLRCCVSMTQHPDPGRRRKEAGRTGGAGLLVLCFRNKTHIWSDQAGADERSINSSILKILLATVCEGSSFLIYRRLGPEAHPPKSPHVR